MLRDHRHLTFIRVASVSIAALALSAAPALTGERSGWTYSIAAGASPRYEYRVDEFNFGSYPQSFGGGFSVSGSGIRPVTRHASLVIEGGYHAYRKGIGVEGFPEVPPTTGRLRAEFFSLGLGLRVEPSSDGPRRQSPYLQATPGLYVSRWEERTVDHEGYDLVQGTWRLRSTHVDSFRSVLPGIALSVGVRGRVAGVVGSDIAVRLTRSADLGEHVLGRFSSGEFRGLTEVAVVAGLSWSP